MRILMVGESDRSRVDGEAKTLFKGYALDYFANADQARQAVVANMYGAAVIELDWPTTDAGFTLLRDLRATDKAIAVILLARHDRSRECVRCLDAGADDFIVEPVAADVLAARIRATTRRVVGRVQPFVEHGAVRVDPAARTVTSAGLPVPLTSKEFALLLELIEHAGQVMTRTRLEESLYSWGEQIGSNALEVHVFNLRRKLGRSLIRVVRGIGYVIDKP